jgi:hypothetical protein
MSDSNDGALSFQLFNYCSCSAARSNTLDVDTILHECVHWKAHEVDCRLWSAELEVGREPEELIESDRVSCLR